jgi:hypothetical protein
MTYWEAACWIVGIVLVDRYVCGWIRRTLNTALFRRTLRTVVADSLSAYYPEGLRPPSGRSRYFSNGNTRFQSFFMLITVQPFFFASS